MRIFFSGFKTLVISLLCFLTLKKHLIIFCKIKDSVKQLLINNWGLRQVMLTLGCFIAHFVLVATPVSTEVTA